MKKIIFSALLLAFLGCQKEQINGVLIKATNEVECDTDVYLNTQEDLEKFNCETVKGNLNIGSNDDQFNPIEIKEYHFKSLNQVDGTIFFNNVKEIAKGSFDDLKVVGGDVSIRENQNIEYIDGFNSLEKLYGTIMIYKNKNLTYIDGFNKLYEVRGYYTMYISNNENLESISGFNSLNYLGVIWLTWNKKLSSILGFQNLVSIYGSIYITYNYNLKCEELCKFYGIVNSGEYNINANACDSYEDLRDHCENII